MESRRLVSLSLGLVNRTSDDREGELPMRQIYPDNGLVQQLLRIAAGQLVFRLFNNPATIDPDLGLGGLTEATFTGYAPVTLDDTDFTTVGVTAHVGFILAPPISFLNSSGGSISCYGYYVTDVGPTQLLAVALFDGAPIIKNDGESFIVVPTWANFSQFVAP